MTTAAETQTGPAESGEDLGRYRLLKKIARGGMAEVFAARTYGAFGFEKTVAIKRILPRYGDDPQFVRMMVDEAKITVLLNHPNVAQILELCEQDGGYFIVMEFVPGVSLSAVAKRLRDKGESLGLLESCFVVVELLQGLHAAHAQRDQSGNLANIIHRDVSPQNVLLNFDGHTKVIDFGIARARTRLEMTEVGTIKGKLRYLAPEMIDPFRFMKSGDFDHRVDVFAAGICLWELLANRTLYVGDDEMAVYEAITETDAPNLHELQLVEKPLADIVKKALTRDPEQRYLTAEEFADDLRAFIYRKDPAFTHKRIAAALDKWFSVEKREMLALERGGASGPNKKAPGPHAATVAVAQSPQAKRAAKEEAQAQQVNATERMRTDPKPAPVPKPRAQQVVDVGDEKAPANAATTVGEPPSRGFFADDEEDSESGRVIGGNTLVSKLGMPVSSTPSVSPPANNINGKSRRSASGAHAQATVTAAEPESPSAKQRRAQAFKENAETLTVADDPTGSPATAFDRPAEHTDTQQGAPPVMSQPQADVETEQRERPRAKERDARDSNRERERERDRAATPERDHERGRVERRELEPLPSSSSMIRAIRPRVRPRMILIAALTGVIVAAVAIGALEVTRPKPPATIRVTIASTAQNAMAHVAGVEKQVPAVFEQVPGDVFDVSVRAPGYVESSRRIEIPKQDAQDMFVTMPLEALKLPIVVKVTPVDASLTVNDLPYEPSATFPVGEIVKVHAASPGYVSVRREVEMRAGDPIVVDIELRPEEQATQPVVETPVVKPKEKEKEVKRPVALKTGTLKLVTKPVWASVTIDGKTFDETTPLSVELKPGMHTVVLSHPPKNWKKELKVMVKSGELTEKVIVVQ